MTTSGKVEDHLVKKTKIILDCFFKPIKLGNILILKVLGKIYFTIFIAV